MVKSMIVASKQRLVVVKLLASKFRTTGRTANRIPTLQLKYNQLWSITVFTYVCWVIFF